MVWPGCPPLAVLRLEAEVEAFVVGSQDPEYVFDADMSSYEVRGAACAPTSACPPAVQLVAARLTHAPSLPLPLPLLPAPVLPYAPTPLCPSSSPAAEAAGPPHRTALGPRDVHTQPGGRPGSHCGLSDPSLPPACCQAGRCACDHGRARWARGGQRGARRRCRGRQRRAAGAGAQAA